MSPTRMAQMRREFDAGFAQRPAPRAADPHSVLVVRVDGDPCRLRLDDIARLVSRPVLTAVPQVAGGSGSLLGLTWCQNEVVAVHDLGRLLGRSPMPPRWMAVSAADPTVGLAFAQFDGHRQIPPGDVSDATYLDVNDLVRTATRAGTAPGNSTARQEKHS